MPPRPWIREEGDAGLSGGGAAAAGQAGGAARGGGWPHVQEADDETPVLREGSEQAAYIYLDLSEVPSSVPLEGAVPEAFDTAAPRLRLPDGRVLEGEYVHSLGSQLFFAPAGGGQAGGEEGLKLVGLSERTVRFKCKQQQAAD